MKKLLLLLVVFLVGCEEQLTKPDIRQELIRTPKNWVSIYGDGFESQQTANIALAIQVINRQGEAIK